MIADIIKYPFLQNAIWASLFSSILCGIIGVIITEKKLVMMSGGIAHTAYGGVGLGYFLGFEPIYGAIVFAIAAAFSIGYIQKRSKLNADIIIGFLWSFGMALGLLFVKLAPMYTPSLETYLFGNILNVSKRDVHILLGLAVFVFLALIVFYNDWKMYLFDSQFAWIKGLNSSFFEYFMLLLVALSVIALIYTVGIILVISMLTAPAASASMLSKNFGKRMIIASLIGLFNCFIGIYISYNIDIASGAAIVMVSILVYMLIFIGKKILYSRKKLRA